MRFFESSRLAGLLLIPLRDDGEQSRYPVGQRVRGTTTPR